MRIGAGACAAVTRHAAPTARRTKREAAQGPAQRGHEACNGHEACSSRSLQLEEARVLRVGRARAAAPAAPQRRGARERLCLDARLPAQVLVDVQRRPRRQQERLCAAVVFLAPAA